MFKIVVGPPAASAQVYNFMDMQSPQLKTSECHSNLCGGNELTNQNPPLAISVPSSPRLTYSTIDMAFRD
jgi:hypothetical protein